MRRRYRLRAKAGLAKPVEIDAEPIVIGRHPDCTIRIKDERASRRHCVIETDAAGRVVVRDLDSRNGTMVNGVVVGLAVLEPGDVIGIGRTEFAVETDARQELTLDSASGELARRGGGANGAMRALWADELQAVLDHLTPARATEPTVEVIDANGKRLDNLDKRGDGGVAFQLIMQIAEKAKATDVHMEPTTETWRVRMRVDGQMVWIGELPKKVGELVEGLVRTAAAMQQAARDAVMDGHCAIRYESRRIDMRVSLAPSVHGRKLVIRVLDGAHAPRSIEELGLPRMMIDPIRAVCKKDAGLLLVCGPTGSGKTTTLHNALREVDRDARNVITIEDPVEYHLEGVTQIPIDEHKGNDFKALLRSVLRQDPDVIMVGEIRDEETARTAMQASMTGHVVFTTVHAKDTIGAIFRLLDLGVEPYLVANSMDLVLAQRLVRVLCDRCKRAVPVPPGEASRIGKFLEGKTQSYVPVGCDACLGTGYRGRRAVFELLRVEEEIRDLILNSPSIGGIRKAAERGLFTTLQQSGWRLASEGATSLEEVERVTGGG
ncbi:MAG: FHA domain-containing protein [Phycisphaerales bacterium]|nr:MAG: FHA domain-containing protein [Phycisphaerales bacterium]